MVSDAPPSSAPFALGAAQAACIWIVIPAYNEATTIGDVVLALREHFEHVIVVDDGSADATLGRAREAGAHVLRHAINRGQGAALQTGITFALERGAQTIVTYDADGQHRLEDIPAMVAPILEGSAEICLGSRMLEHGQAVPWFRRAVLALAVAFTRLTTGMKLTDTHNGFRAFSRRAAGQLNLSLDRMAHASELLDQVKQMRLPYREVSVRVRYTDYSRAKGQPNSAALRIAFDYLVDRVLK